MKILATCLIMVCVFCQNSFANTSSGKSKREIQESQQRMAQLQEVLERAKSGSVASSPGSSSDTANAVSTPAVANQDNTRGVARIDAGNNSDMVVQQKPSAPNPFDQAFSGIVNQMLPMSPEQIAKLRKVFTESQSAAATPPGIPPKPTSTSLVVNLSPQATPPVIRLGAGYITSLVFVDNTGQPWPIKAYSVGDPSAFNIQWDRKGNTLLVQSTTFYKRSNLAVMLSDLNTPVMITLIPGQGALDYRVDLHIPGIGPNAVLSQAGLPEVANPLLLDVLSGIPVSGSKELKVRGGNAQAWSLGNKLYLRTSNNLNVISPAWQATMRSADGTNAYQLPLSPVILATQNGTDRVITLRLE